MDTPEPHTSLDTETSNQNDYSIEMTATQFSECVTDIIYGIRHPIPQTAVALQLSDTLPISNADNAWIDGHKNSQNDALDLLETWVNKGSLSYGALLGEYGMGKTTTCMLLTQRLLEKRKNNPLVPLPIYLDLRNIADKIQDHQLQLIPLINSILKTSAPYETDHTLYAEDIIYLAQQKGALIIFDGLDEVLAHLSPTESQYFSHSLLNILSSDCVTKGKILLACRTHYFRTIQEQKNYLLEQAHLFMLLPFEEKQIREYLTHAVSDMDINTLLDLIRSVHNLSDLAERPYTLSLIPELIPYIEQWNEEGSKITGSTIYRHIVLSWLERDSGRHHLTVDHKLQLMEHLAAAMWQSGKRIWNIIEVESWLSQFLVLHHDMEKHYQLAPNTTLLNHILEALQADLRTATFLVRVGDSDFRFAHTSLQEFFLATYLYHALVEGRIDAWDMAKVSQETLDFLGQLMSEEDRTSALSTLQLILGTYRPRISEQAFAYMLIAHAKDYPVPVLTKLCLDGANLKEWRITGKPGQFLNLQSASFRNAHLENAHLHYANLNGADFTEASLIDTEVILCQAQNTCFENANLMGLLFIDVALQNSNFLQANLSQIEWLRCNLTNITGLSSIPANALITECEPQSKFNLQHYAEGNQPDNHQALILTCVFSPDEHYLASASADHTLRLWDTTSGRCIKIFNHNGWVFNCAFSPDAHYIVSAVADKTLQIWNISTGECQITLTGHQDRVRSCVFLQDGQQLASTADDKTIRIWDITTGECRRILTGHQDTIKNCALSPLGHQLASASDDNTLRLWDINTGECLRTFRGHTDCIRKCVFSIDGQHLISASGDKTLRIWNTNTGECLKILAGHTNKVRGCAVSFDGKLIASASYDRTIRIWDAATGECVNILNGHWGRVRACLFSKSGQLVSASDDLTIRLWDINTGQCLRIIGTPTA